MISNTRDAAVSHFCVSLYVYFSFFVFSFIPTSRTEFINPFIAHTSHNIIILSQYNIITWCLLCRWWQFTINADTFILCANALLYNKKSLKFVEWFTKTIIREKSTHKLLIHLSGSIPKESIRLKSLKHFENEIYLYFKISTSLKQGLFKYLFYKRV